MIRPNDLIVAVNGGVYFTDFGATPGQPDVFSHEVYFLPPGAKQPVLIDDSVPGPNGIILSNDGRTLLVDSSFGDTVFAYDVQADGTATNRRPFARLQGVPASQRSRGDGMAIDREGRVYVTSAFGIQVFDSGGRARWYLRRASSSCKPGVWRP